MAKVLGINSVRSVLIQKKWGTEAGQGLNPDFGIYQLRKCKEGKISIKMKFYTPANPQTQSQQDNRQKLSDAVAAYQILTDEQKAVYHKRAIGMRMSGYNLYIREQMYG